MLEQVGMPRLRAHVARLTDALLDGLKSLRRDDGSPLIGSTARAEQARAAAP